MGLFGRRDEFYRQQIASLLGQLSDRDTLIFKLIEQHAAERQELVTQLLAATRPGAVTELRRDPNRERVAQAPPRPNFPGLRRDLRPPVTPGLTAKPAPEPASDQEAVDAVAKNILARGN